VALKVYCQISGLNLSRQWSTHELEYGRGRGNSSGAVKCVEIGRTPVAKALYWAETDTERRKLGERIGLDTLVSPSRKLWRLSAAKSSAVANALSLPPGEYARKSETQRN
jgi:hypothetical protein